MRIAGPCPRGETGAALAGRPQIERVGCCGVQWPGHSARVMNINGLYDAQRSRSPDPEDYQNDCFKQNIFRVGTNISKPSDIGVAIIIGAPYQTGYRMSRRQCGKIRYHGVKVIRLR